MNHDIYILFMVMVCFHYLLASKNTGLSLLRVSFLRVLFSLVSGGFVKYNAANLIPV